MYNLLIKQFFRLKTVWLALGILVVLGFLSISTGKQFLSQKEAAISKTIVQQQKHLETQRRYHKEDIGLLSYYLKFSFIKPINPLAGISIGQSDLNSHIQSVGIVALESQKHDTDLVNPMRLQVGNLDISFLVIFLLPLVIIALNFNLLSEEEEKGTWKMIKLQSKSPFRFLLAKLSIRLIFVVAVLMLLLFMSKMAFAIPFNQDFLVIFFMSFLYVLFWFALCFFVILLQKSSNTNAIVLLTCWIVLLVFIPVLISDYISNTYPIDKAFAMTIKQRDAYHQKWDTDKKETLDQFYSHYPTLKKYGYKTAGFSWLWYYAMQQMGDDDSKTERVALYTMIKKREELSKKIAQFLPPLQLQLSMNRIAETSLSTHIDFLDATTKFHEDIRLELYPKIFEDRAPDTVNFEKYKPEFFKADYNFSLYKNTVTTLLIIIVIMGTALLMSRKSF